MKKITKNYIFGILLLIIFGIFLIFLFSLFSKGFFDSAVTVNINSEGLISFLSSLGAFSYIAYVLLIIAGVILAPIHPLIFYVAGGIFFGPYVSWVLIMAGVAIGSFIAFSLSRRYGRTFVNKHVSQRNIERFDSLSEKYGPIAIFLLRVNPITSSDVWSYLAGLTKIKFWKFLSYTLLGLAPAVFIQVYFGKEIGNNPVLFKIFVVVAILYLVFLFFGLIYFLLKKSK